MSTDILLFKASSKLCGLPVEHVREVLRPLPLETFTNLPRFVAGCSLLRGQATPVVDVRILLGCHEPPAARRLISVREARGQCLGLLADEVLGVTSPVREGLPPLLELVPESVVEELSVVGGQLLAIMAVSNFISDSVWQSIQKGA